MIRKRILKQKKEEDKNHLYLYRWIPCDALGITFLIAGRSAVQRNVFLENENYFFSFSFCAVG